MYDLEFGKQLSVPYRSQWKRSCLSKYVYCPYAKAILDKL